MNMHGFGRILLVAITAASLGGCVFFETRADRNLQRMPNFKAGYSDGCASADAAGTTMRDDTTVRDDALYESDKAYRAGWAAGRSACRPIMPSGLSNSPVPDRNPGGGR